MSSDAVISLKNEFGASILEEIEFRGEHTVVVKNSDAKKALQFCRDNLGFDYLIDVSSLVRQKVRSSSSLTAAPSLSATTPTIASPHSASGTPTTDASSTAWWHSRRLFKRIECV